MKKHISMLLALSLILSICPRALAADSRFDTNPSSLSGVTVSKAEVLAILPPEADYDEVYQQIVTDFDDISSTCVEADLCTPVRINEDGLVLYEVTFPNGIVNQITSQRNSDDCVVLDFYEGDLHNEVIFLKNGNLLVDEQLVNIQGINATTQSREEPSGVTATPRMRNSEFSLTPWGKASDYTKEAGNYSGNKCSWGVTTLVSLATGTVAAILCAAVSAGIGYSIGYSIFSSIAAEMITRCKVYGMEDEFFSWYFDRYERKDSMSLDRYYKYEGACYSKENLKGHKYPHIYYYHNWFS